MPLSFKKLESFFSQVGFLVSRIFTVSTYCVYIELLVVQTGDSCLFYIPSKYDIEASNEYLNIPIVYIDIDDNGNFIKENYIEGNSNNLYKQYTDINIDLDFNNKSIIDQLEENYNRPVNLDISIENELQEVKENFRQLKRLKLCVQNLKYKLCIIHKGYLCCIRRDNTYECYKSTQVDNNNNNDNDNDSNNSRLCITIDLENFFEKINTINNDLLIIRQEITNILNINHNRHSNNLLKIINYKLVITDFMDKILNKKTKLINSINLLEKMMIEITSIIKKINSNRENTKYKYNQEKFQSYIYDSEKYNILKKYDDDIKELNIIRQEIVILIIKMRGELDDISLKVDKICFDNSVMLDLLIKNFEILSNLSEN